jgi:hypothetical protein
MAKEESVYMLLTYCQFFIISLKKGLELMLESGEPMEFDIFDFYNLFSRDSHNKIVSIQISQCSHISKTRCTNATKNHPTLNQSPTYPSARAR